MAPKFRERPIFVIQRGSIRMALDAIDGKIDSIIRIVFFSRFKSNSCREITKESSTQY
jgi:hypothetical protein